MFGFVRCQGPIASEHEHQGKSLFPRAGKPGPLWMLRVNVAVS